MRHTQSIRVSASKRDFTMVVFRSIIEAEGADNVMLRASMIQCRHGIHPTTDKNDDFHATRNSVTWAKRTWKSNQSTKSTAPPKPPRHRVRSRPRASAFPMTLWLQPPTKSLSHRPKLAFLLRATHLRPLPVQEPHQAVRTFEEPLILSGLHYPTLGYTPLHSMLNCT